MKAHIHDLAVCLYQCSQLGLVSNAKWCSELLSALSPSTVESNRHSPSTVNVFGGIDFNDFNFITAKAFFDTHEFERCSDHLKDSSNPKALFLKNFSLYLAGEKVKDEGDCDALGPLPTKSTVNPHLNDIYQFYAAPFVCSDSSVLAYHCYLYGLCCARLGKRDEAITNLVHAASNQPFLWSAWFELATLMASSEELQKIVSTLPKHPIVKLFATQALMELQHNQEALIICRELVDAYPNSVFILCQCTMVLSNLRDLDGAIAAFEKVRTKDPFRLDAMDAYSNALYVKEDRVKLSSLVRDAMKIDKYRPETCCIAGNYYSLIGEHDKSIEYFQRALRLNSRFLSAWTLLGHEYIEVKNVHAAIESYRRAIDVNEKDYRAWFGLGQAYELLRMPFYALYYYQKAAYCRPSDARMWIAIGSCYEALGRTEDSAKCYQRGTERTDNAHLAYERLACVYEKSGQFELSHYYAGAGEKAKN